MTTSSSKRRLRLHKETLRTLSTAELDAAQGGGLPIRYTITISVICCDSRTCKP